MFILNLDLQLRKHPVKKDVAVPRNQTNGLFSHWPAASSTSNVWWFCTTAHIAHTAWVASVLLDIAHHPTHVVVDLGCTRSMGPRAALKKIWNIRGVMGLRRSFAVAINPLCLPTLRQRVHLAVQTI